MKTVIVKNTNNKYSIREDGTLFINYRTRRGKNGFNTVASSTPEVVSVNYRDSTKKKQCYSLFVDNKRFKMNVNSLLKTYFNTRICFECKTIFEHSHGRTCDECSSYFNALYYNNCNNHNRLKKRDSIKNIDDSYLYKLLNVRRDIELPSELLQLKREQIKLHRELKKQQPDANN